MNILIIRHAEATGNPEGRMQGQGNFPLTPNGMLQAQRLAQQLLNTSRWPTAIYSSPIERAKQTTEILIQVFQEAQADTSIPPVHYRDDLREFNHGIFEGMIWSEAQQAYPDLCEQLENTPTWIPIPQAESLQSGRDRAEHFFRQILNTHQNTDTVWIVSHQWILQHLMAVILGCDRTWQLPLDLAGAFEIALDRDLWFKPGTEALNSTRWQIRHFNTLS